MHAWCHDSRHMRHHLLFYFSIGFGLAGHGRGWVGVGRKQNTWIWKRLTLPSTLVLRLKIFRQLLFFPFLFFSFSFFFFLFYILLVLRIHHYSRNINTVNRAQPGSQYCHLDIVQKCFKNLINKTGHLTEANGPYQLNDKPMVQNEVIAFFVLIFSFDLNEHKQRGCVWPRGILALMKKVPLRGNHMKCL